MEVETGTGTELKFLEVEKWIEIFYNGTGGAKKEIQTDKTFRTAYIVYGRPGTGKSYHLAKLAQKYTTVYLNSGCVRNRKDLFEDIEEASSFTFPGQRKLVIVDDFDVITGNDKMLDLKKMFKTFTNKVPIVLICDYDTKKVKEFASVCKFVCILSPTNDDLTKVIVTAFQKKVDNLNKTIECNESNSDNNKNLKLEVPSSKVVQMIVEHSNGDIANAIQIVSQYKCTFTTSVEEDKEAQVLTNVFTKKDTDPSLYEIADTIPNKRISFVQGGLYFDMEKSLIPLLVHENYPDWIEGIKTNPRLKKRKGIAATTVSTSTSTSTSNIQSYFGLTPPPLVDAEVNNIEEPLINAKIEFDSLEIDACADIMSHLSTFDTIENKMYMYQNMYDGISLPLSGLGINGPNSVLLKYREQVNNPSKLKLSSARFTNMISKLASKKARENSILNLYTVYGNMNNDTILLLRNKIYKLIRSKTASGIKLAASLLIVYELDVSVVDSLLRMFVFKDSGQEKSFVFTVKMKTMLTKEYRRQVTENETRD